MTWQRSVRCFVSTVLAKTTTVLPAASASCPIDLSNDDCLEDKRKIIRTLYAVLRTTVVHNDKHTCQQSLKLTVGLV